MDRYKEAESGRRKLQRWVKGLYGNLCSPRQPAKRGFEIESNLKKKKPKSVAASISHPVFQCCGNVNQEEKDSFSFSFPVSLVST